MSKPAVAQLLRRALHILEIDDPNPVSSFVAQRCFRVAGATTPFKMFRQELKQWCLDTGRRIVKQAEIVASVKKLGLPYGHGVGNQVIVGDVSLVPVKSIGKPTKQIGPRVQVDRPRKPRKPLSEDAQALSFARSKITKMKKQGFKLTYIAETLNRDGYQDADGRAWTRHSVMTYLKR